MRSPHAPDRPRRDRRLRRRLHRAWALGSAATGDGLKGYFLGESNIPAWAVMISIVATETSAVTFLSVPGIAYRGDMTFLQLAFGYILARIVVAVVLLPAYFKGRDLHGLSGAASGGSAARPRRRRRSSSWSRGRSASGLRLFLAAKVLEADHRLATCGPRSSSIGASTVLYTFLGGIKGGHLGRRAPVRHLLVGAGFALAILLRKIPGGWRRSGSGARPRASSA